MSRILQAEKPYLRSDLPDLKVGDSVEVDLKVKEGDKERIQTFAGTVIGVRGGGTAKTFTVRRIVQGEGVERILPYHSPLIDAIRVVKSGRVRRAKLYYMRRRVGKATRLAEVIGHGEAGAGGENGVPQATEGAGAAPEAPKGVEAAPSKK
jgi:large subunit ribosomal protein L19